MDIKQYKYIGIVIVIILLWLCWPYLKQRFTIGKNQPSTETQPILPVLPNDTVLTNETVLTKNEAILIPEQSNTMVVKKKGILKKDNQDLSINDNPVYEELK